MGLFDAVGQFLGTDKSGDAIAAQQAASAKAAEVQKQMYDQSRADLTPWRTAGEQALTGMQGSDYMRDFTLADFNQDPGYQFRMDEANKALERSAAAKGGLMSGSTLRGITKLNQDYASQEYNNAYNRFNADRDRRFGRLSNISGMGLNAAGQTANNAMQYGKGMADTYTGLGNAEAAANIASGNAASNLIGQGIAAKFAFSDKRLKKDIEEVSKEDLAELRKELKAYRFKYKNEKHGKGDFIGVMAQDLQKSRLGKTLITEDEKGFLQLDLGKVLMLFLATQAEA